MISRLCRLRTKNLHQDGKMVFVGYFVLGPRHSPVLLRNKPMKAASSGHLIYSAGISRVLGLSITWGYNLVIIKFFDGAVNQGSISAHTKDLLFDLSRERSDCVSGPLVRVP